MLILILELIALFLLIFASIAFGWELFINRILNSQTLIKRWQEKEIGKSNSKIWGQVYESFTYKPIAGASVKIFNAKTNKQIDMTTTDNQGKYGFEVPDGKFYLRVNSFYHNFPSIKMMEKNKPGLIKRRKMNDGYYGLFLPEINDKAYENIYFGEVINNRSRALQRIFAKNSELLKEIETKSPIILNIPLDKSEILTLDEMTIEAIMKQGKSFSKIKFISLVFGLILTISIFIIKPNLISLISIEIFLLINFYSIFQNFIPGYEGHILNNEGEKISKTLIRARGYQTKKIRATAISDQNGYFKIKLNPGWYYFELSHEKYNPEKRLINIEYKRKLNLGFKINKILP